MSIPIEKLLAKYLADRFLELSKLDARDQFFDRKDCYQPSIRIMELEQLQESLGIVVVSERQLRA